MTEILLDIGPDTGDLPIPALPPGHEWASARLRVRAEPTVTLTPPLQGPGDPAQGVPWISAEWGAMRPLTALTIAWADGPRGDVFVAMKVATGGVWFTPVPPGRTHPKSYQPIFSFSGDRSPSFPPVTASGLLLELRAGDPLKAEGEEPAEARAAIRGVTITVMNPVLELSITVGNGAPVVQRKGRLAEAVDVDLLAALRAAPPGSPLRLRATAVATVAVRWEPQAVARPSAPPPAPTRPATLGALIGWTQPLESQRLVAVAGRIAWDVAPERLLLAPTGAPDPTLAQAVFVGQEAAQSLGALADPPHGVDVWITAVRDCAGVLRLVGDRSARPVEPPIAEGAWTLAAGEARWVSLQVPPKTKGPLWIVCRAERGEALIARVELPGGPAAALQRRLGGAWETVEDGESRPHLHIRVRAPAPAREPTTATLRRGDRAVRVPGDGPFALDPAQVATLNEAIGPVHIEVTAPGGGAVTLADWQVRLAP